MWMNDDFRAIFDALATCERVINEPEQRNDASAREVANDDMRAALAALRRIVDAVSN